MLDVVYTHTYIPNLLLNSGYSYAAAQCPIQSDRLGFTPECAKDLALRIVCEVAMRALNLVALVYCTAVVVIYSIPAIIELNIRAGYNQGFLSLAIFKVNWLFLRVVVAGIFAQVGALLASGMAYKSLSLNRKIADSIVGIQIALLPSLPLAAFRANVAVTYLPDQGARLLNQPQINWREELAVEISRIILAPNHGARMFWEKSRFPLNEGLKAFFQRHYTAAELQAINDRPLENDRLIFDIMAHLRAARPNALDGLLRPNNEIKPCQLAFHRCFYDAVVEAGDELVEKKAYGKEALDAYIAKNGYSPEQVVQKQAELAEVHKKEARADIEAMFGEPFHGTLGIALLKLLQRARFQGGLILGPQDSPLKLVPFSHAGETNFQSTAELLQSIVKGVSICSYDAVKEFSEPELQMLRAAVRRGCNAAEVNAITAPRVREFATLLRANPQGLHEFQLWDKYEPKLAQDFIGLERMTEAQKESLYGLIVSHETADHIQDVQIKYAFKLIQNFIGEVIMRRLINMHGYSDAQKNALPNWQMAFKGERREQAAA